MKPNNKTNSKTTAKQQQIDTNKNGKNEKEVYIEDFFKTVWSIYPNKKGIAKVNKKNKADLYELGLERVTACINSYIKYVDEQRKTGFDLKYQNGSTFFNSGYKDYLNQSDKPIAQKVTISIVESDYLNQ